MKITLSVYLKDNTQRKYFFTSPPMIPSVGDYICTKYFIYYTTKNDQLEINIEVDESYVRIISRAFQLNENNNWSITLEGQLL